MCGKLWETANVDVMKDVPVYFGVSYSPFLTSCYVFKIDVRNILKKNISLKEILLLEITWDVSVLSQNEKRVIRETAVRLFWRNRSSPTIKVFKKYKWCHWFSFFRKEKDIRPRLESRDTTLLCLPPSHPTYLKSWYIEKYVYASC